MTASSLAVQIDDRTRRRPRVPDAVLGMLIFVVTEAMFFAGLISAHTITKAASPIAWPPPGQPRLPIESTAINTAALLASGFLLVAARRAFAKDPSSAKVPYALAMFLGGFFVFAQGVEWVDLIREGLTLTSSTHGSFFYLIVGAHAFHAIAALSVLAWGMAGLVREKLTADAFSSLVVLWSFVVGVWPFLYLKVYL